MKKLPQTLDLGMSNRGGRTGVYARNIQQYGDWATIAHLTGEASNGDEIHIDMNKDFNKPEYLAQIKAYLKSINSAVTFADESSEITVDAVLAKIAEDHKLMSFEIGLVKANPFKLHELVLSYKKNKSDFLPSNYDYEVQNNDYPLIQVWGALTKMISA